MIACRSARGVAGFAPAQRHRKCCGSMVRVGRPSVVGIVAEGATADRRGIWMVIPIHFLYDHRADSRFSLGHVPLGHLQQGFYTISHVGGGSPADDLTEQRVGGIASPLVFLRRQVRRVAEYRGPSSVSA
jgi:hypothetical protein